MARKKKITTLVPVFGSNRQNAHRVGQLLRGCTWVGITNAGGMSEIPHIVARTLLVNDLHRHIINLAQVVAIPTGARDLIEAVMKIAVHPDALEQAQDRCRAIEHRDVEPTDPVAWAVDYFVAAWMARNGKAGTKSEFDTKLAFRYEAGGGDSAVRFYNAAEGLDSWHQTLRRCTFTTEHVRDMLPKCRDLKSHGIYYDGPFPGPGDAYKYRMTADEIREIAGLLGAFKEATIVCRFYDTPLVAGLFPEGEWDWLRFSGRDACNNPIKPEALISRRACP